MTESEYRNHPAISRSELFKITESPEKFKHYRENPEPPTPSLLFGQFFHAMCLEPKTVWDSYIVAPNLDKRTKEGKAAYEEFDGNRNGRAVVTAEMAIQATAMCEAIYSNQFATMLLSGEKEKPFFWTDDLTGEECKCRVDCLTEVGDASIVVDLKTADCADTEAFTRSAVKYGYDLQAAMYLDGVNANTNKKHIFVFVVIEKKPPYSINIMQSDEFFVRRGKDLFRELIGIYHDCKQTGNWYGYLGKFNQINNLALPAWLARTVE